MYYNTERFSAVTIYARRSRIGNEIIRRLGDLRFKAVDPTRAELVTRTQYFVRKWSKNDNLHFTRNVPEIVNYCFRRADVRIR